MDLFSPDNNACKCDKKCVVLERGNWERDLKDYKDSIGIREIYGIRNTSGNRYQQTKRIYSEMYPLYNREILQEKPDKGAILKTVNEEADAELFGI